MILTEQNFITSAMHCYDNPQCHSVEEFEEDLKRFFYIKKLFSRYRSDGVVRERLVLNHIIVLYNLFGDATTHFLFHKINKEDWAILATFLVYLNRMPEIMPEIGLKLEDITLDQEVVKVLREL